MPLFMNIRDVTLKLSTEIVEQAKMEVREAAFQIITEQFILNSTGSMLTY